MKKTFTINISGIVFHIDDDAYDRLNNYLSQVNRYFGNDADATEIVGDIESRISELFQERVKDGNEVITIDQVDEIIRIMGMPEAFADSKEEQEVTIKIPRSRGRKLYRDPDERVLGGVCSGLGAFFNLDPIIMRLIFILLFFGGGSSLIIYLIMWIVVPKAVNTVQRLEMKGEEVNINNISKTVREEFQDVKENFENFKSNKSYIRSRERINGFGDVIVSVLQAILKIVLVIFGIILVAVGVFLIIALFTSLFISSELIGISPFSHELPKYLDLFVSNGTLDWFWVGLALTIGVPLVMLAYLGTKLIFRFESNNPAIGMSSLGLWVFGIILLVITAVRGLSDFKSVSAHTKQEAITTKSDTMYLRLGADEFSEYLDSNFDFEGLRIASINGKRVLLNKPRLDVEKSDTPEFSLVIKTKSRGHDTGKAQSNAREIIYKFTRQDSLLTFQPWFMLPENSVWHKQEVDIILKVPENKTIYLDNELVTIISDIANTSNMYDGDMGGKYWTMKPEGLELTQKKQGSSETPKKIKQ